MKNSKKCIKCGGNIIKAEMSTAVRAYGEEKKVIGKAPYQEPYIAAYAYVCEECGYMEFYMEPRK